jgi:AcrR family transcriptional regulator
MPKPATKRSRRPALQAGAGPRARNRRLEKSAATREAILAAALDEFAARGFAAARLDDVARRAGVAKGTIYVHFRDKVTLFEELVRSALVPVIAAAESAPIADMPLRLFAERLIETFVREIYGTRRKDVLRLIITEGERFPQLAHIYYREVIARALKVLRAVVQRAVARGEIGDDALLHFPQLLIAPGLVGVIWDALFARFEPLDVAAMMRRHLDLLFEALERRRT